MKNIFLLLLLTFSVGVSAQNFGIRGGVNLATQDFENNEVDAGTIVGYQLGINYEVRFNDHISVRPGIMYATKGSSQKFPDLTAESRFHYVEVPVDLVYDLGIIDIFAGPYIGYAFKAVQETDGESIDIDFDEDNIKKIDAGVNFGANIDLNERIYLGAYYSLGLSDLTDDSDLDFGSDESIKNKSLSAFVALRF